MVELLVDFEAVQYIAARVSNMTQSIRSQCHLLQQAHGRDASCKEFDLRAPSFPILRGTLRPKQDQHVWSG